MLAIKTEGLTYTYSVGTPFEKTAVDHVDLEIEQGEFVGVIGHTGSGKSTLIQHFNGLLKPTSGRVLIHGTDLWAKDTDRRAFRFKVGLVFQYPEYQLFEETVYKDIAFGPVNMGLPAGQVDQQVREAAAFVGLREEILQKSPFELSGGQKRRVAIAGVLAMNPDILVLDEPTAGLDPKGREKVLGEIKSYHKKRRNTILLVSHSMEDIARYADRIIVMNKGRVMYNDSPSNVFEHYQELEKVGLAAPQVTYIMHDLRARGLAVRTNVTTVGEAAEEIMRILEKRP